MRLYLLLYYRIANFGTRKMFVGFPIDSSSCSPFDISQDRPFDQAEGERVIRNRKKKKTFLFMDSQ